MDNLQINLEFELPALANFGKSDQGVLLRVIELVGQLAAPAMLARHIVCGSTDGLDETDSRLFLIQFIAPLDSPGPDLSPRGLRASRRKEYRQKLIYKYNALAELERILESRFPNPDFSIFDGNESAVGKIFEERPDLRWRIRVREYRRFPPR